MDVLYQAALDQQVETVKAIVKKSQFDKDVAIDALKQLLDEGKLVLLGSVPLSPPIGPDGYRRTSFINIVPKCVSDCC